MVSKLLRDTGDRRAPRRTCHDYYQYTNNLALLVNSAWCLDQQISRGRLTLDVKAKIQGHAAPRQALVKFVSDDAGAPLAVADPDLAQGFQSEIHGRWLRLNKRPPLAAPDELVQWFRRFQPGPPSSILASNWWRAHRCDRSGFCPKRSDTRSQQMAGCSWFGSPSPELTVANGNLTTPERCAEAGST